MITRRSLLSSLLAAPVVVAASSLMPVRGIAVPISWGLGRQPRYIDYGVFSSEDGIFWLRVKEGVDLRLGQYSFDDYSGTYTFSEGAAEKSLYANYKMAPDDPCAPRVLWRGHDARLLAAPENRVMPLEDMWLAEILK